MAQRIDERIKSKIHQLVGEGVRDVREMQRHIKIFVKNELFRSTVIPTSTNRRYHPKLKDIRNHMYAAAMKMKFSKLDQENLGKKVEQWKLESPTNNIFYRGYGEIKHTENDEQQESDINKEEQIEVCHWST